MQIRAEFVQTHENRAWESLFVHEIGHVLGLVGFRSTTAKVSDTEWRYTGAEGVRQYRLLGGTNPGGVPLHSGTVGHWDAEVLQNKGLRGCFAAEPPLSWRIAALPLPIPTST